MLVDSQLFPTFGSVFSPTTQLPSLDIGGDQSGPVLPCGSVFDMMEISEDEDKFYSPDSDFSLNAMKGLDLNSSPPPSDSREQVVSKQKKNLLCKFTENVAVVLIFVRVLGVLRVFLQKNFVLLLWWFRKETLHRLNFRVWAHHAGKMMIFTLALKRKRYRRSTLGMQTVSAVCDSGCMANQTTFLILIKVEVRLA